MLLGPMAHASAQTTPVDTRPAAAVMPENALQAGAHVALPRLSVAAIMIEAGQALLWDHSQEQYVAVRVGDAFRGFTVTSIALDQVALSRGNQHFLLSRTSDTLDMKSPWPRAGGTAATGQAVELADPYAAELQAPAPAFPAPAVELVDPYAAGSHARAPHGATEGRRVGALGSPAMVLEPRPAARGALGPPAMVLEPRPRAREVPEERYTVERREIDAAMADFQSLGTEVQVELTRVGVNVIAVAPTSLPYRMGLRAGDVILAVDGLPIASMNDAAAIYAHLLEAQDTIVTIKRGDRLIRMRYRFA